MKQFVPVGLDLDVPKTLTVEAGEHEWINFNDLTCCRFCGIVQRRDGKNRPCKGLVQIVLRSPVQIGELPEVAGPVTMATGDLEG